MNTGKLKMKIQSEIKKLRKYLLFRNCVIIVKLFHVARGSTAPLIPFTLALHGGKWSATRHCRFIPMERVTRMLLDVYRTGLTNVESNLPSPQGIEPRFLNHPTRSQLLC
jgi:hypothetical protein